MNSNEIKLPNLDQNNIVSSFQNNSMQNRDVYCFVFPPPREGGIFSSHLGRFLSCRGGKRRKEEEKGEKGKKKGKEEKGVKRKKNE